MESLLYAKFFFTDEVVITLNVKNILKSFDKNDFPKTCIRQEQILT